MFLPKYTSGIATIRASKETAVLTIAEDRDIVTEQSSICSTLIEKSGLPRLKFY